MKNNLNYYIFNLLFTICTFSAQADAGIKHSTSQLSDTQLEDFMRTAKVIEIEDIELGITQPKRITLKKNNVTLRAVFKTYSTNIKSSKGRSKTRKINSADRFQNDLAAYQLDLILDLDMIPVTVYRKLNGKAGAVQSWIENSITQKEVHDSHSNILDACAYKKQEATMDVFDILIHNDDRNLGNVLYTVDNCRLWMIDHSRSFRVKISRPKSLAKIKIRMSEQFADKLRRLNTSILEEKIGEYVSTSQIKFIIKRRDLILSSWQKNGKRDYLEN